MHAVTYLLTVDIIFFTNCYSSMVSVTLSYQVSRSDNLNTCQIVNVTQSPKFDIIWYNIVITMVMQILAQANSALNVSECLIPSLQT